MTIADLVSHPRGLQDQCRQLVDLAATNGAEDDLTVVAARYHIPQQADEEANKIA